MAKKIRNSVIHVIFFITIHFWIISASVELTVSQEDIEIGKPLNLSCKASRDNISGSRRWLGGKDENVVCLNGVSLNPKKYREFFITNSEYVLQIQDLSWNDLYCLYSCVFGFQSDEKIIPEQNHFLKLPTEDSSQIEYAKNNGSYSLGVKFQEVSPVPTCLAKTKFTSKKQLTLVGKTRNGHFYDVQFSDKSEEPFHACDNPVEIECSFAKKKYSITKHHEFECSRRISASDNLMRIMMYVTLTTVTLLLLISVGIVYIRRKYYTNRNPEIVKELPECCAPLNGDLKSSTITMPEMKNVM